MLNATKQLMVFHNLQHRQYQLFHFSASSKLSCLTNRMCYKGVYFQKKMHSSHLDSNHRFLSTWGVARLVMEGWAYIWETV